MTIHKKRGCEPLLWSSVASLGMSEPLSDYKNVHTLIGHEH